MRPPARRSAPAPAPNWFASNWQLVAAAAIIAALAAWFLWPSGVGGVRNLTSSGTAIIAFGDSLTAGYGAPAGEDYPSRLSALTAAEVINAGVSGDTTESALARLSADVLSQNPRIVIVGLGGNDFLRGVPIASTEENLRAIIGQIQGAGAMVLLLGFRFPSLNANYEGMYERIADETGSLLVPDVMDGILRDPSMKSDEIHPNGRGYALMAERVAPSLRKLLR